MEKPNLSQKDDSPDGEGSYRRRILWSITFLAAAVIIGFLAVHISDKVASSNIAQEAEGQEQEAWQAAQDFVSEHLVAPSTAKFIGALDNVEYLGNGQYRIRAAVDSQNSFGAMIRSSFSCVVVDLRKVSGGFYPRNGPYWKLESLNFAE